MSCLLFIGTFLIAWHLKKFKAQSFFTNGVRGFISDFAVIIAILTMTGVDVWANVSEEYCRALFRLLAVLNISSVVEF